MPGKKLFSFISGSGENGRTAYQGDQM